MAAEIKTVPFRWAPQDEPRDLPAVISSDEDGPYAYLVDPDNMEYEDGYTYVLAIQVEDDVFEADEEFAATGKYADLPYEDEIRPLLVSLFPEEVQNLIDSGV